MPRPSSAWTGPLSGRMLPQGWKDAWMLSPPRGSLRLGFYSLRLLTARVKGSGQECPLYTSQSSGRERATRAVLVMVQRARPRLLGQWSKTKRYYASSLKWPRPPRGEFPDAREVVTRCRDPFGSAETSLREVPAALRMTIVFSFVEKLERSSELRSLDSRGRLSLRGR